MPLGEQAPTYRYCPFLFWLDARPCQTRPRLPEAPTRDPCGVWARPLSGRTHGARGYRNDEHRLCQAGCRKATCEEPPNPDAAERRLPLGAELAPLTKAAGLNTCPAYNLNWPVQSRSGGFSKLSS